MSKKQNLKFDSLVSIVMPAYNSEKYISDSINSVVLQTYNMWELIIVNDGSNDNTASIVKSFKKIEPRIRNSVKIYA